MYLNHQTPHPTELYQMMSNGAKLWQQMKDQVAALTKERDELEISNAFAHGEWRAVKDQLAAMTKEKNDWYRYHGHVTDELVISQAREAKLRELWEVVEKEYFARLKEQDEEAAKFEAEKDMYGWNFHKGLRGGLVEFHIYMTKIVKALALPTDDSALMERLKEERERAVREYIEMLCHDEGYWCFVCGRFLPANEDGVIVHDNVPHPEDMTFDEEERPQ